MNKAFRIVPSVFFILLASFWIADFYMSLGVINYTAIAVVVLLMVQLFHNQKYVGLVYGMILILFSAYMICHSIIDYATTDLPTDGTFRFLIIKSVLFGTGLLMALALLYYYFRLIMPKK